MNNYTTMIRKIYYLLPLCLFLLISNLLNAQIEAEKDTRLWTISGISYKINPKISTSLIYVQRFKNNIKEYMDQFIEPGIQYKFNKNFNIKAAYRYTVRPDIWNQHWLFIDINNIIPLWDSPLFISNRIRLHYGIDYNGNMDADFFRDMLKLNYNGIENFILFFDVEPFIRLNQINKMGVMRYEAGAKWNFHPQWTLTAYYRRQDNYTHNPQDIALILQLPVISLSLIHI